MIAGIGVDMIPIRRIERLRRRRGARALERIFAPVELDYCMALAHPAPSLAVRFAAKEAFFKAMGTGWPRGGRWTEVCVERSSDSGRPSLTLHGSAARLAQDRGITGVHLSLSHTRDMGAAFVVLET